MLRHFNDPSQAKAVSWSIICNLRKIQIRPDLLLRQVFAAWHLISQVLLWFSACKLLCLLQTIWMINTGWTIETGNNNCFLKNTYISQNNIFIIRYNNLNLSLLFFTFPYFTFLYFASFYLLYFTSLHFGSLHSLNV